MVSIDYYAGVGYALELLAQSEYHRRFKLGDYFRVEILPALRCGQARFYLTDEGVPTAMVTWAWLPEAALKEIHRTGRAIRRQEWSGGDCPFINDCVAPHGNMRDVAADVAATIFPHHIVSSLRRRLDGSVRRVNRWTGINLRKAKEEALA